MNKPLLLTISTDQGIGLGQIVIDFDKVVAMYEVHYDNEQEAVHRTFTRILPMAGQHLQVTQLMMQIWGELVHFHMDKEEQKAMGSSLENLPGEGQ